MTTKCDMMIERYDQKGEINILINDYKDTGYMRYNGI